jgi:hypothetical protein
MPRSAMRMSSTSSRSSRWPTMISPIPGAILYPSVGLFAGAVHDPDLSAALCRAYNRICEPRVQRTFEHRADRHRLAAGVVRSWLGDRVIRKLDPQMFCWLVGGLILLSGIGLLAK